MTILPESLPSAFVGATASILVSSRYLSSVNKALNNFIGEFLMRDTQGHVPLYPRKSGKPNKKKKREKKSHKRWWWRSIWLFLNTGSQVDGCEWIIQQNSHFISPGGKTCYLYQKSEIWLVLSPLWHRREASVSTFNYKHLDEGKYYQLIVIELVERKYFEHAYDIYYTVWIFTVHVFDLHRIHNIWGS